MLRQRLKNHIVSIRTRGTPTGKYYTSPLSYPNRFILNTLGLQLSIGSLDLETYGDILLLLSPVQE